MRVPDTGMTDPPSVTDAENREVVVNLWLSEIDGVPVVQIDTFEGDVPQLRVCLNDGTIWDNGPISKWPRPC